jgi:hypothetical protein
MYDTTRFWNNLHQEQSTPGTIYTRYNLHQEQSTPGTQIVEWLESRNI